MHTWLGSRWERFFDVVAGATVIAVLVSQIADQGVQRGGAWFGYLLLAGGTILVLLRRWFPLVSVVGSVATSGLVLLTPAMALPVWVMAEICLFSLPLRRSRRTAIIVAACHAALLYVGALVAFEVSPFDPLALILPVWTGAVVAFGTALRTQQDYVAAVEDRARTAASAREIEVLRRVGDERLRIARDLHDSVANALAVINLQATNAERHVADDAARTRAALGVVRTVSRSTLTELAAILMVLRDDEIEEEDRTVATTANLPHLIELYRSSGLDVHADIAALAGLRFSPAADAAVFRVVQESLTNAQRHGDGRVEVTSHALADGAVLEIMNTIPSRRQSSESGFGLVGMHERVELAGGRLTTREAGAVFTVRAEIPTDTPSSEKSS